MGEQMLPKRPEPLTHVRPHSARSDQRRSTTVTTAERRVRFG